MKNRLRLVLICLMLCMLSGCTFSNAGIEAILKAPKISDEQSQIYQALIDSTGKNIQLKYPLSGDNRSSFVITNIDSESTNEAIVFYKKVGASTAESNIRINILDQFEGKWRSVYDISEVGEEVDRVIVSYLGESKVPYLIVGFGMTKQSDKILQVYNYSDGELLSIFSDTYSVMDVADIDMDRNNELISINRSGKDSEIKARMYKIDSKTNALSSISNDVALSAETVTFTNITQGMLKDNTPALFVDCIKGDSKVQTEVLVYRNGTLKNPLVENQLVSKTIRSAGYYCADIDGDSQVEIPVTRPFKGYEEDENTKTAKLLTEWYTMTPEGTLEKKYDSYYNLNNSYVLAIINRWMGLVTVKEDTSTDEMVFYKYDNITKSVTTELMRIKVTSHKNAADYFAKGYQLIKSRGQIDYLVKFGDAQTEPLVLSMSELSDSFYVL